MHTHLHQDSATSNLHHSTMHNQQSNIPPIQNHPPNQPLSWTCELCGRMFANRDEWSIHAKSHLEVKKKKSIFILNSKIKRIFFGF